MAQLPPRPPPRVKIKAIQRGIGPSGVSGNKIARPRPKAKKPRKPPEATPKKPVVQPLFRKPDDSELKELVSAAVASWAAENPATARNKPPKGIKYAVEPLPFLEWMENKVFEGLKEVIKGMEEGPFIKKTTLKRLLAREAQKLTDSATRLHLFEPPSEALMRRVAAEAVRSERIVDHIRNFREVCSSYCLIVMCYEGGHVEEYVYLSLMREVERLKKGTLMRPCELQARLEAAANMAIREIGIHIRLMASDGVQIGSFKDGTVAVRFVMGTHKGHQKVFLLVREDEGARVVYDIMTLKRFNAMRFRSTDSDSPGYVNQPHLRH